MSRKKIVAGNWKMNMTIDESNDLINELKEVSENNVEIKIAPSFTNLYNAISLLKNSGIEVIAQNVHSEKRGAYTCLLYTSPSPRDLSTSRMPSSA